MKCAVDVDIYMPFCFISLFCFAVFIGGRGVTGALQPFGQ